MRLFVSFLLIFAFFDLSANEQPIGYPDDAQWVEPETVEVLSYWCVIFGKFYGGNTTPAKVDLSICSNWFLSEHDKAYTNLYVVTTNSGGYFVGTGDKTKKFVVNYTTTWRKAHINPPVSGVHNYGAVSEFSEQVNQCPPDSNPEYTHPHDSDNDGEIDRCYNPDDKLVCYSPHTNLSKSNADTHCY
ncbi:hypothetical protein [Pseudoalteromonas sp. PS5]|uniref:hypothetical protein n=1 Tax=Pseudoalteromonas sp. PS5 TaxID=1437473 RepID=UPI000FFEEB64|nr:hypothetical protein [Pseudoalteromonas sp. PS5]RXF05359.1 hypothetical protein D9603_04055 [Pseudoalteromonas sp. PS5]